MYVLFLTRRFKIEERTTLTGLPEITHSAHLVYLVARSVVVVYVSFICSYRLQLLFALTKMSITFAVSLS